MQQEQTTTTKPYPLPAWLTRWFQPVLMCQYQTGGGVELLGVNNALVQHFGWVSQHVPEQGMQAFFGPLTDSNAIQSFYQLLERDEPASIDITLYHADRTYEQCRMHLQPQEPGTSIVVVESIARQEIVAEHVEQQAQTLTRQHQALNAMLLRERLSRQLLEYALQAGNQDIYWQEALQLVLQHVRVDAVGWVAPEQFHWEGADAALASHDHLIWHRWLEEQSDEDSAVIIESLGTHKNKGDRVALLTRGALLAVPVPVVEGWLLFYQSSARNWQWGELSLARTAAMIMHLGAEHLAQNYALKQRLEKEREVNRQQQQFVLTVSHEFRTPLSIIDSALQLLNRAVEKTPETIADMYARQAPKMHRSIARMNHLIRSALQLVQLDEAMQSPPRAIALNLKEWHADFAAHMADEMPHHAFEMMLQNAPETIVIDAVMLEHILSSLVQNAEKYSPDGSRVELVISAQNGWLEATVADEGAGIEPEDVPHIFEKYYRGKNSQSITGSGIGLYLAHQLATQLKGSIHVKSVLGQGSVFTLRLPYTN